MSLKSYGKATKDRGAIFAWGDFVAKTRRFYFRYRVSGGDFISAKERICLWGRLFRDTGV